MRATAMASRRNASPLAQDAQALLGIPLVGILLRFSRATGLESNNGNPRVARLLIEAIDGEKGTFRYFIQHSLWPKRC